MLKTIKNMPVVKKLRKTRAYSRLRQHFPMAELQPIDDRGWMADAEAVTIDWPAQVSKPRVGVVRDFDPYPRWTKYCRFLDRNGFPYDIYDVHAQSWLENARQFDVIVGMPSCEPYHLEELREKYFFMETFLGKMCYPSLSHTMLYENKRLEAYIAQLSGIPFAPTRVSHAREDALRLIKHLTYPVVSKIVPGSGSYGVELVPNLQGSQKIVTEAFSRQGRKTCKCYLRQKNYVYFQDYIPNDGYDIRVIVIGRRVFGYYRKVLQGDFRASGMGLEEKRALPEEAMRIALQANKLIKSPILVADMLHGLDGKYYVIELSPLSQVDSPEELHVNGIPGNYVFHDDGSFSFEEGKYWIQELALRQFFLDDYLPRRGQWASAD